MTTAREQTAIELIAIDLRAFYNCRTWRRKSKQILKRDRYECQECKSKGKYRRADCVHHILDIQKHPHLAFTDTNLISLCKQCHNEVHDKLSNMKKSKPRFTTPERW